LCMAEIDLTHHCRVAASMLPGLVSPHTSPYQAGAFVPGHLRHTIPMLDILIYTLQTALPQSTLGNGWRLVSS
jgi:hypothetical protein